MMAPRRRVSVGRALAEWAGGRLASLLLLALCLWLLLTMRGSQRWRVQWVEVAGCDLVAPETVVQASELADSWSVSLVPDSVRERIEALPGVVEATVSVGWPARIRVGIREDVPLATVRLGDEEYWVAEESGLMSPFGHVEDLPALRLVEGDSGVRSITPRILAGLAAMRAAFPDRDEYLYHSVRGFEVQSERGYPVYLGDASDLETRLTVLAELESDLADEERVPELIDVSALDGAYYR